MIDLGTLKIGVTVDKDSANKGLQEVNSNVDKADGKFKDLAKTVGTATLAIGAAAGAMALKLGKEVISAFGDYEQLVGGIDTLFKESSNAMQGYAENAYKTAGLSANEYMETVTGFSASLISSLGGDTELAVEYANMAITDMSDNANKMGSSMESIQNAYQGFAKQNYTMLDNLKLGYGGTKEEMERLLADATAISGITYDVSSYADVVDAIHVIQVNMDIAGTTALEAEETIQGSVDSFKSAFDNLIVGLGDADADMGKLMDNVVETFKNVVTNITPIIKNIADALPEAFSAMLPVIGELLPDLLSTVADLFQNVLEMLLNILPQLIPVAVDAIMLIVDTLIDNLPLLIESAITLIMALTEGLMGALPQLIPAVVAMIVLIVTELIARIPEILEFIPVLFKELVSAFGEVDWATLGGDLMRGIVNGMTDLKDWVVEKVKDVAGNVAQGFKDFFGIASPSKLMFGFGLNIIQGLASGITDNESIPLNAITTLADKMISNAKDAVKTVMNILNIGADGSATITNSNGQRVAISRGNDTSQKQKAKDLEKHKDEIYAIANKYGKDVSVGYEMWKTNERDKIYGREETYGVNQTVNVYSPKALSPSEVANATKKTLQKLVLGF